MKKFLTLTLLAGAAVLLAACGKLNFDSGSSSTSGTKPVVTKPPARLIIVCIKALSKTDVIRRAAPVV